MREHSIPMLLTAHHATDNAETVLLRLCRGTGLRGLGGIAPVRPLAAATFEDGPAPVVVRPLLAATRKDVLAACERNGLDYITDSTNADTAYARNRVRHEVLPVLGALTDCPEQSFTRLCASLREDEDCLTSLAVQLFDRARSDTALLRAPLADAHPAVAKRTLRLWLETLEQTPEAVQLDALLSLCRDGKTSQALTLDGGTVIRADRTRLYPDTGARPSLPSNLCIELSEGEHTFPALGLRVCLVPLNAHTSVTPSSHAPTNVYKPFIRDTLTYDTIISYAAARPLWLCARQAGDRLLLRGMHRRLRKLQNERGLPPTLRERLPLVRDDSGILWAPAIGLRDGADKAATHRLTLTLLPILL